MKYERVRSLVVTTMTFNNFCHYYVLYAIGFHRSIKRRVNSKMFFNRRRIVIALSAGRPVTLQPPV